MDENSTSSGQDFGEINFEAPKESTGYPEIGQGDTDLLSYLDSNQTIDGPEPSSQIANDFSHENVLPSGDGAVLAAAIEPISDDDMPQSGLDAPDAPADEEPMDVEEEEDVPSVDDVIRNLGELNELSAPMQLHRETVPMETTSPQEQRQTLEKPQASFETEQASIEAAFEAISPASGGMEGTSGEPQSYDEVDAADPAFDEQPTEQGLTDVGFEAISSPELAADPVAEQTPEQLEDDVNLLDSNPGGEREERTEAQELDDVAHELDDVDQGLDDVDQGLDDVAETENEELAPDDEAVSEPADDKDITEQHDVTEAEPQDINEAEPQDINEAEPQDVTDAEPQDVTDAEPQDVTDAEPQDVTEAEPQDGSEPEPQDVMEAEPQDVSEVEAQDVIEASTTEDQAEDRDVQEEGEGIPEPAEDSAEESVQVTKDVESIDAEAEQSTAAQVDESSTDVIQCPETDGATGEEEPIAESTEGVEQVADETSDQVKSNGPSLEKTDDEVPVEITDSQDESREASAPDENAEESTGAEADQSSDLALKIGNVQGSEDANETDKLIEPETITLDDDDDVAVVAVEKPERRKSTDSKDSGSSDKGQKSEKKTQECLVCNKVGKCKYNIVRNGRVKHLCDDACFKKFRAQPTIWLRAEKERGSSGSTANKCHACNVVIGAGEQDKWKVTYKTGVEKFFCKEACRDEFKSRKNVCVSCGQKSDTTFSQVVKGGGAKTFCSKVCVDTFEKSGEDDDDDIEIVGTSRQAPKKKSAAPKTPGQTRKSTTPAVVGTVSVSSVSDTPTGLKGTALTSRHTLCTVCKERKAIKHEVSFNRKMHALCSDKCFAAFRYANKLTMTPCDNCGAFCNDPNAPNSSTETIQFEGRVKRFCGNICLNSFKMKKKKMIACSWCNTKKSNFDMVERVDANNKVQLFCSLNCLSLYRVNLQATSNQHVKCDQCSAMAPAQYHLTMSDASVRNFCSYSCVINFQSQFSKSNATPGRQTGGSQRRSQTPQIQPGTPSIGSASNRSATRQSARDPQAEENLEPRRSGRAVKPTEKARDWVAARQHDKIDDLDVPVISNVVSLAAATAGSLPSPPQPKSAVKTSTSTGTQSVTQHIIIEPPKPKQVKNKALLCKPYCLTKATSCRPHTQTKETQTDGPQQSMFVPVPVPIYLPTPMAMYSMPFPYPVPIPVPIPIPAFIPTTKKSADGILKQIKEIQERMPADPFEAELLMMAEAVATADKSDSDTSSESEDEVQPPMPTPKMESLSYAPHDPNPGASVLGEDMLQMALRMANEISEEPMMDMEVSIAPTPVHQGLGGEEFSTIDQSNDILSNSPRRRSRGRGRGRGRSKRQRQSTPEPEPDPVMEPKPAPDQNMVLKYTYGVNAWKHWVVQKNEQLQKASSTTRGKLKMFKTDMLQCTADELNYSLCLFVKEVRKPNAEEYAPDSIFYLSLGIQQYLYENGRIDNIFADIYYERFNECLNDVLQGFEVRLNHQGLLVCRIEEEHLWESKQLGAHSPYILLNTLIYFNTKYFLLKTPEEHIRLSFSHIMKHWKRANGTPITGKNPGQQGQAKSVYLRYYAPSVHQAEAGQKRKREEAPVFEQAENTDNPLRCPVKLYEFYLSKCLSSSRASNPESIKNRNDVFYLVPERSCVPDSPVWYSTAPLGIEVMTKMLNRLRLVREIQEAHLTSHPMIY